jgi:predicted alpha/beta-fold hydrolase
MLARLDLGDCPTPVWLPEGHTQTIFAALYARRPRMGFLRERVDTPDGDFIDLDWTGPGLTPTGTSAVDGARLPVIRPRTEPGQRALVLFHGLEGSSGSHYILAISQYFRARGWTVVVPHFRGCSGEPNRLPRAYHSGDSQEIGFVLELLRARLPEATWHAAGISLGGNALLKHLGEAGTTANWLHAAAAISAPLDLNAGGAALGKGLNHAIYTRMFLRTLKTKVLAKARHYPGYFDVARIAHARDLHEFDDAYTAPVHGFKDVKDYWTRASAKPYLISVTVPTLVLNARNDPFLPAAHLPKRHEASAQVLLHQPPNGGHAGFSTGRFPSHLGWLPQRLARFFDAGV